jgi:hypothetical protein
LQTDKKKFQGKKILSLTLAGFVFMVSVYGIRMAFGAEPAGSNWFQIYADPFTGRDNSGDGGTGNSADLNYFYVDQIFDGDISISSTGTTAANIWIDYDPALLTVGNILTGTYFNSWKNHIFLYCLTWGNYSR